MITLEKLPNGLSLHVENVEDLVWLCERHRSDDGSVLTDIFDNARLLGNGWNVREASDFGFLSEAPCVTWMEETDEDGRNPKSDTIYYWSMYEVRAIYDELIENKRVFLRKL